MAIGDFGGFSSGSNNNNQGNNNNNNKLYENTYYSRIKIKSQDGKLALGFSFRAGLLAVDIAEQKENYQYDTLCSIYLSPTKAGLLANELKKFIEYYNTGAIENGKAFGVNAGMAEKTSFIGVHANTNKDILITIGKVDNSGNITEQATIALNREYHYALEWDNIKTMDVSKVYYDMTEINQFIRILEDFSVSMNGAYAYSAVDLARYDNAKLLKKMDPIYDALGIERRYSGGGNGNNRGGGFFSNSNNNNRSSSSGSTNSNRVSFDELEDGLMGDD